MRVEKRDGKMTQIKFDKVVNRMKNLITPDMKKNIQADLVAQRVFSSLHDGMKTSEIDELVSQTAMALLPHHTDYGRLAAMVVASNIQKNCPKSFSDAMNNLRSEGIISFEHQDWHDSIVREDRDFLLDYFGLKTLEKSYLMRNNAGRIVETPQYLWLRVSIGLHGDDELRVRETYEMMSKLIFTHATPTLFNSGTPRPQLSSCFLMGTGDSIEEMYKTLSDCAQISKWSGGIGLHVHDVRSRGSRVRGTNGFSSGIIPMLRVFNSLARHVDQSGRRKGSIAVYLEPWHADIEDFLDLRLNTGDEESRCRDLFTAIWMNDLFMERLENDQEWSLFCPDEAKGLSDVYGEEFEKLYKEYESQGIARKTVPARDIWMRIVRSQVETGTPYIGYKDIVNRKTNHQNVGIIKSSNLCHEIMQYSDTKETAVCNLASISLPKFVVDGRFDYDAMMEVIRIMTRNLNKVIDINFYPTQEARLSNQSLRPIGIGVQGLADVFILLDLPFDSHEAREINAKIFESIYFAAVQESIEEAKKFGAYSKFQGSPMSKGILQQDMWEKGDFPLGCDWDDLKKDLMKYGTRNSLLIAPMPTASTSQILGNNECFEPYTSNIYTRRTLAGEFTLVNKHLVAELMNLGIWNEEMRDEIISSDGSIQNIEKIPSEIRSKYKTVWEISQKVLIDMAADRGRFVDQSQSMNLFMENPSMSKISSMQHYAWRKQLKTGQYYLRTKAKSNGTQVTIAPRKPAKMACTDEICVSCSS